MMIVDTSAWIDFFRGRKPVADLVDQALDDNSVAICGPILTELHGGFKTSRERDKFLHALEGCRFLSQPSDLWETAGLYGFALKRKGITAKTIDLLIACHAIAHGIPLLTANRDFKAMQAAGLDILLVQ